MNYNAADETEKQTQALEPKIELTMKLKIIEDTPLENEKAKYDHAYNLWYNDKPKEAIKEFKLFISMFPNVNIR